MGETFTNNISDQSLAILELQHREQQAEIKRLAKENEDIKTALVDLIEKYAV